MSILQSNTSIQEIRNGNNAMSSVSISDKIVFQKGGNIVDKDTISYFPLIKGENDDVKMANEISLSSNSGAYFSEKGLVLMGKMYPPTLLDKVVGSYNFMRFNSVKTFSIWYKSDSTNDNFMFLSMVGTYHYHLQFIGASNQFNSYASGNRATYTPKKYNRDLWNCITYTGKNLFLNGVQTDVTGDRYGINFREASPFLGFGLQYGRYGFFGKFAHIHFSSREYSQEDAVNFYNATKKDFGF